jgi:hypothetical protein
VGAFLREAKRYRWENPAAQPAQAREAELVVSA